MFLSVVASIRLSFSIDLYTRYFFIGLAISVAGVGFLNENEVLNHLWPLI
jgi:hypothetical protein